MDLKPNNLFTIRGLENFMLNPMLSKKAEKPLIANENAKKLFQAVYREKKKESVAIDDDVPKINVSEMISKMAFFYEKIRNSVDYSEEYLLRKNAIDRILKRKIVIEGLVSLSSQKSTDIAKHLLTELIRAGYLPNNKLPETKIDEIAIVINKYLLLRQYSLEFGNVKFQERSDIVNWIISIAASEIEGHLCQNLIDAAMVKYLYEVLVKNIGLPSDSLYASEKEIQIYIGIHRNLLKFDQDMLSNILLKYYNSNWLNATEEDIRKVARNIIPMYNAIDKQINHPLAGQMNRLISRYTVFSSIMVDVIKEDPEGVYDSFVKDPKVFSRLVKNACNERYKIMKSKLWRAAVKSIIFILLTKSILIFLEIPVAIWLGEEINKLSVAINITFPALLLFMIVLFTKLPSNDNTQKITEGIEEMMFVGKERKEPFKLRPPKETSKVKNAIFGFIYAITFFLTFGAIIWFLDQINFHWISIVIFLFFLAFVSFFSVRIRKNAKELIIVPPKENFFSFIADFFYIPIVETGKWLSEKFAKINVFVFFLDFIIETPFKIFVDVTEEWAKYVKERKDEI